MVIGTKEKNNKAWKGLEHVKEKGQRISHWEGDIWDKNWKNYGASHRNIKWKNSLGRKNSKYKDSEVEACLAYLRNSKEANGDRAKEKGVEDEVR